MRIDEQVVHADDIKEGSGTQFYGTPIREMSLVDVDVRIVTNEEKFPMEDWQYDVANGDTKLGYAEWVLHNVETEQFSPAYFESE